MKVCCLSLLAIVLIGLPCLAWADIWHQTTWTGGPGQEVWEDSTRYLEDLHMDYLAVPGDLTLGVPDLDVLTKVTRPTGSLYIYALIETSDGGLYTGLSCENFRGAVFKSTDGGRTWTEPGSLEGATEVRALLETDAGTLLAGTYCTEPGVAGLVFRSTDMGETWSPADSLEGAQYVYDLLQTHDGCIYAGTAPNGDVFRSIDDGLHWDPTGELYTATRVYTLLEVADGSVWAGTYCYCEPYEGKVFCSSDSGESWVSTGDMESCQRVYTLIELPDGSVCAGTTAQELQARTYLTTDGGTTWTPGGEMSGSFLVFDLLVLHDGRMVAATGSNAGIFSSSDRGTTWIEGDDLEEIESANCLVQLSNRFLYVGTEPTGRIFVARYHPEAYLVSSVYDAGKSPHYGRISWNASSTGGTITVKVRTGSDVSMNTASPWNECPPCVNREDISALPSVNDGDPYVQYRVELTGDDPTSTPNFHDIALEFETSAVGENPLDQNFYITERQLSVSSTLSLSEYTIRYVVNDSWVPVHLAIYNLAGQRVRTWEQRNLERGDYQVIWNGTTDGGATAPDGIYVVRLATPSAVEAEKIVLLR
jgi:photosystem II stability/assembly factor-like uncharacterized protein